MFSISPPKKDPLAFCRHFVNDNNALHMIITMYHQQHCYKYCKIVLTRIVIIKQNKTMSISDVLEVLFYESVDIFLG